MAALRRLRAGVRELDRPWGAEYSRAVVDIPTTNPECGAVRRLLPILAAVAAYSAVAAVYLLPILAGWSGRIAGRSADPVFNLYVLKWSAHQLRLGLPDLWDANFFYPAKGALTFSDHLLGPALGLLLLLDLHLVPDAVAGYNLLLAASFVLLAAATCWVLRASGRSWIAAVLGGGMYAFAPTRWAHFGHIQILLAQWIPLTLWTWDRLLARPTWRRAAAFLTFYLLNLAGGSYLAYMTHVPLLAIGASRAASSGRQLLTRRRLGVLLAVAVPAAAAVWLLYHPYVQTARRYGFARSPAEVSLYAATLPSYLAPSDLNLYAGGWHRLTDRWDLDLSDDESRLFPGFLAAGFFLYGAFLFLRRHHARPQRPLAAWQRAVLAGLLLLAAAAFLAGDRQTFADDIPDDAWLLPAAALAAAGALWLLLRRLWGGNLPLCVAEIDPWERGVALGGLLTFLLSFPIVFVPLMRVVPGLAGMRAPGRFDILTGFALVFFAAKGLDACLPAAPARRRLAAAALAALLAVELAPAGVDSRPLPDEAAFPAVYRFLATPGPARPLLELPRLRPPREALYMYYSTLHWQPIANGYSGFLPAADDTLRQEVPGLPDAQGFAVLRNLGIADLVVHTAGPAGRDLRDDLPAWERQNLGRQVDRVFAAQDDRVYRLRPEPPPTAAPATRTPVTPPSTQAPARDPRP